MARNDTGERTDQDRQKEALPRHGESSTITQAILSAELLLGWCHFAEDLSAAELVMPCQKQGY